MARPAAGQSSAVRSKRRKRRFSNIVSRTMRCLSQDRQNIVVQKLADLNSCGDQGQDRSPAARNRCTGNSQPSRRDASALDTFPAILANQFIQQQKTELANLQRQQASLRKVRRASSRDAEDPVGDSSLADEARWRDRKGRPGRADGVSGRAGAGAEPDRGPSKHRRAKRCR